jgi:uncharacterized protein (DUF1501 family)
MMHSRRDWLWRAANGFGGLAFSALQTSAADRPFAVRKPHFAAKAKSVIFLFMDGGPSQIDTFDPKPMLEKYHGKPFPGKKERTQFNNDGQTLASPWKFSPHGQSGLPISTLFPEVAKHADKLAVVRSVTAGFSEHTNANYFFHTGNPAQGRPSAGAWVTYGLGAEADNLPGFVVLGSGMIPPGGMDCFGAGFLPAAFQGSMFRHGPKPVSDLAPSPGQAARQKLAAAFDRTLTDRLGAHDAIDAAIANSELAARMQLAVPAVYDLKGETKETLDLYGIDQKATNTFGRQCLIARRLVERGVRFVELLCPHLGYDRWDQHNSLKKGHEDNARAVDRPIAGLLDDLARRGLLDSTLVFWGGEFGRTPFAQGADGRDHNPFGFSVWFAGGGTKGGLAHGATDDFGYHAVAGKVTVHDLHATMLHLIGLDHTKLTMRFGGRDMRLTDVHGEIIAPILA